MLTDRVKEEWPQIPETPFSTHGRIGFSGTLEGPLKELKFDLQTDLSQVKVTVTQLDELTLAPGPGDKLTLSGTISPQRISLDHGAFKWNILKGHASGSYATEGSEKATYRALLIVEDLTRLEEILPLLGKFQIKGQAELDVDQQGLENNNRPEMTLTLRNGGLHATRFIADLSQINGRIKVTENGLAGNNLQVHLGQSPVIVQARLEDLSNPRLILDAKAPSVRADDLIFYSDKAKLRDVDGHLEIDRDGLLFAPVNVRLDGGTDASVRGTISFHPPYDVELDITSGFTNVSEVIGLWADRPVVKEQKPVPEEEKKSEAPPRTTIRINALSQAGDLYGMEFHDASAAIIPTRGQLLIHPLDFSVGEGFCNAQVIVDFPESAPTRLRVSGHAEDVDALKVYQDLLNQKNIVRGKLRGDFYLTGELGSRFIPTSRGNFSIAMREGVLHQFQILSKIFSLLNVSQLFAFQMPDMDLEGMPFDTLSANLQLEDGILKSEDLRIRSRAMNQSYVGQLDLVTREVDLSVAIQPLGTVDKIVSSIPIAGWLLTGDDGALLTAYFSVKGNRDNVSVQTMPLGTLSGPTMGLLKRTLGLPFKLIEDPQILWGGDGSK